MSSNGIGNGSTNSSSSHHFSNYRNSLTPMGRPRSAGSKGVKAKKKGSPLQKIAAVFRRERSTEDGTVPVRPSCFADDDRYQRRSASPEGPTGGKRGSFNTVDGRSPFKKTWRPGKETKAGTLWRPKGRCEWESDSGRMLTLQDTPVGDLSQVEVGALQRLAINQLQEMDLPVSHAILKAGSRNMFQRLSFNTFQKKKVSTAEGPEPQKVIFGQPLTKVLKQDQPGSGTSSAGGVPGPAANPVVGNGTSSVNGGRSPSISSSSTGSGSTTPVIATNPKLVPPPVSPTGSLPSDSTFIDGEPNPTTRLLEALSVTTAPSPMAQRRMSLYRSEPQVPLIVKKAIQHLDTTGVKTEGLFRIPGAKSRITEIRERFDAGYDVDLEDTNPHDVACLLKEFFRSLPEPLLTRELYQPFLTTRKLQNPGQRRDALRLLVLLLPAPNRDTLQELLQFLSRVALHSDGIILIDGTEETGNRMTEQNLAMVLGPNILHRELRRKGSTAGKGDYIVVRQDPEEIAQVCKVMEDLIRMHISIFMVPAKLHDAGLKSLLGADPDAVDQLLKRKCYDQGLYLNKDPTDSHVLRSRSSEALRKISQSGLGASLLDEDQYAWRRSRSLSDTQKTLDEAIKNLEQYLDEELVFDRHRHYSSNDSAMGESETVLSPFQPRSEPSTLSRNRQVFASRDSAFSNNSSPTNSSEGGAFHSTDLLSFGSDSAFLHTRMSSNISGASVPSGHSVSPTHNADSPKLAASPSLGRKGPLCNAETVSLPTLSPERDAVPHPSKDVSTPVLPQRHRSVSPVKAVPASKPSRTGRNHVNGTVTKKKRKLQGMPSISAAGTFSPRLSPILNSKPCFASEPALNNYGLDRAASSDHTPTESTTNVSSSAFVWDTSYEGTVI